MKRWSMLLAGLAFAFAAIPAQQAEAQVMFGPQVVLWDLEEIGIGARVDFGLAESFGIEDGFFEGLYGSGNISYLLLDGDGTPLDINLNANVPLSVDSNLRPFVGAGINYLRFSAGGFSTSFSGLNLLGGLNFDLGQIPAFAELKYSTSGAGFLTVSAGVMFGG